MGSPLTGRDVAVVMAVYEYRVLRRDQIQRRAHFLLEIDRATEANRRWADKVCAYLRYSHSGRYSEKYRARSLRVLAVTTSRKRLDPLKRTTERAGGLQGVLRVRPHVLAQVRQEGAQVGGGHRGGIGGEALGDEVVRKTRSLPRYQRMVGLLPSARQ